MNKIIRLIKNEKNLRNKMIRYKKFNKTIRTLDEDLPGGCDLMLLKTHNSRTELNYQPTIIANKLNHRYLTGT